MEANRAKGVKRNTGRNGSDGRWKREGRIIKSGLTKREEELKDAQ